MSDAEAVAFLFGWHSAVPLLADRYADVARRTGAILAELVDGGAS